MHLADGTEDPKTKAPAISLLLAYAAMIPIAAGALASMTIGPKRAPAVTRLTIAWSGGVLCFLSGVRRGLSFRQADGPTLAQLAAMMWLFLLGTGALVIPRRLPSLVLLLIGYASMASLDPAAARHREAPRYFARLRPAQMLVPVISLLVLIARDGRLPRDS